MIIDNDHLFEIIKPDLISIVFPSSNSKSTDPMMVILKLKFEIKNGKVQMKKFLRQVSGINFLIKTSTYHLPCGDSEIT